jgi:hypothetical protein
MQIYCPRCGVQLAAQDVQNDTAKCHSCARKFNIAEAATDPNPIRALTPSESLRRQLDKMARGPVKSD